MNAELQMSSSWSQQLYDLLHVNIFTQKYAFNHHTFCHSVLDTVYDAAVSIAGCSNGFTMHTADDLSSIF